MIDEEQVRREKLSRMQSVGIDPYPQECERSGTNIEALSMFDIWSAEARSLSLVGRIITIRVHGGIIFADMADATAKIQLSFKEDLVGPIAFSEVRDMIDPGDFIEATGTLFLTKRGEKTLAVKTWKPLAKALLPLPEKWHGLKDVEARYRERELDLLSNPEVRERFILRSKLVTAMRRFLDQSGFLEVETPMLHAIPGGANAKPFVTHHNTLDIDLYLRIAPELFLKRLIVGGFEKVYEVARCFRNEGMDPAHNPEFTQIELYWAYAGKEAFIDFLENFLTSVILETTGASTIVIDDQVSLDFTAPWPRVVFAEVVRKSTGIEIDTLKTLDDVIKACKSQAINIDFSRCRNLVEALDELYKKTARAQMVGPVWVLDYPVEMMPLANRSIEDTTKAAIAQLIVQGKEIVKAFYYELNNPLEQEERLRVEQKNAEAGSDEAQHIDEAYIRALKHGMPPTSGMGIGIDRFVAILTGAHHIKEVILFPTLRPQTSTDGAEPGSTESTDM